MRKCRVFLAIDSGLTDFAYVARSERQTHTGDVRNRDRVPLIFPSLLANSRALTVPAPHPRHSLSHSHIQSRPKLWTRMPFNPPRSLVRICDRLRCRPSICHLLSWFLTAAQSVQLTMRSRLRLRLERRFPSNELFPARTRLRPAQMPADTSRAHTRSITQRSPVPTSR